MNFKKEQTDKNWMAAKQAEKKFLELDEEMTVLKKRLLVVNTNPKPNGTSGLSIDLPTLPSLPGMPSPLPSLPGMPSPLPSLTGMPLPSTLPSLPGMPMPSTLPSLPGMPSVSTLPSLPGMPGMFSLPTTSLLLPPHTMQSSLPGLSSASHPSWHITNPHYEGPDQGFI